MKFVKRRCLVRGVSFVYYEGGRGPVIFIAPPFHSDVARIRPLLDLLAENHRVIIPELPGIATKEALPDEYEHTAQTYALFLVAMIRKLRIRNYILFGLSLGAIIGFHMLMLDCPKPRKFITYGAPVAASDIRLPPEMKFFYRFYSLLRRRKERAVWFARTFMVNPAVLAIVFGLRYVGYKGYLKIIANQVHLTANMHPRAWVELIDDIFSYDFPADGMRFSVPALHMYNKYDNILDIEKMGRRLVRLFPLSRMILLEEKLHAPLGPVDRAWVTRLATPMMHFLEDEA